MSILRDSNVNIFFFPAYSPDLALVELYLLLLKKLAMRQNKAQQVYLCKEEGIEYIEKCFCQTNSNSIKKPLERI